MAKPSKKFKAARIHISLPVTFFEESDQMAPKRGRASRSDVL
jgi:hypothetical protein